VIKDEDSVGSSESDANAACALAQQEDGDARILIEVLQRRPPLRN